MQRLKSKVWVFLAGKRAMWRALQRAKVDAIVASSANSWFNVRLNGVPVALPRYTMMTMRHCILAKADGSLDLSVEINHWERIRSHLADCSLFLDVGAATGAMSVPYALSRKNMQIVAFEPSRRARSYLEATISRNGITTVTVLPFALADAAGIFEFVELPEDETGDMPNLPEASHLSSPSDVIDYGGQIIYPVEVERLDNFIDLLNFGRARSIVVKIDVEGFEAKVLQGARETLLRFRPLLSIDIHNHPGTTTLTDKACIDILQPLGYRFDRMGHVLFAEPS